MANLQFPWDRFNHLWKWFAILIIVIFVSLRFIHLDEDFPYQYVKSGDINPGTM
jgi:hypothetical protein